MLTQLQASEADKFVAHLYQARKHYRIVCDRPNKGNKAMSAKLSQATKSRRAWDSTVTFAPGSTCCEYMSEMARALR